MLQYLPIIFVASTPDLVKSANFVHIARKKFKIDD